MNKSINYKLMIGIVANLHSFIDEAESAISMTFANFNSSKNAVVATRTQNLQQLTARYNASHAGIKSQSQKIISDAQGIYDDMLDLEAELAASDKYFVKTKIKKEQELLERRSERYDEDQDYFAILNDIKARFQGLVRKYSRRSHRGLIDGINYLVSSQRKADYEELIVLKNTVLKLIKEINETIPALTNDSLAEYDKEFIQGKENIERQFSANMAFVEQDFNNNIDIVADQICQRFDSILPDSLIDELKMAMDNYDEKYGKLDPQRTQFGNYIILGYLTYPYRDFIQSSVLIQLLESKCEKIIYDGVIRLPVMCALDAEFNWMIENNDITTTDVAKLTHSLMFGFLSSAPVSKVQFCVCDAENRGNSIIPFLEMKKKVPDMFFGKAFTTQEEIHERLYQLSNYIDDFIQNKLGNKYDNIFEYNEGNPNDLAPITVLVLYDFPRGFDERNLAELKNVIRNGNRCGIFSIICHNKKAEQSGYRDFGDGVAAVSELCTSIRYDMGAFWLNGLELSLKAIPSSQEINSFADKYMLIMEGRKNEGLIFPPAVNKLFAAKDENKLNRLVDDLSVLQRRYAAEYGNARDIENTFPQSIMLGSIEYPAEIFPPQIVSACIQKGLVKKDSGNRILELPLTCEFSDKFNVFINTSEETEDKMLELTHSMLMSFFSSLPYGKLNVSVFDCEKRGNSIVPYLEFKKKMPDMFDGQIYTGSDAIQEKLNKINKYIDDFIQEKLGNSYSNIVEYNLHSTSKQEAVQLLLIYDFPKGFDNRSYEALMNIVKNGGKCGVYTIICYNPEITLSRYDNHSEYIEQIQKMSTCFSYNESSYVLSPYNLKMFANKMLSGAQTAEFVAEYFENLEQLKNKGLAFQDIIAPQLFSCNAAKSLSIPMGVGSGDSIIKLTMGERSSHHGLIAGATGSGKSTLLHTIIMSSMLNYSPEQLNLYLMDFKSGTEFKIYESVKLPHIKLLALDAMQEFGESILEDLVAEMGRRGDLFKEAGQSSLKGYSEATGKTIPRILVIMDEFQILFNDSSNRKIALNCAELTKRIVTEGRAFGIHLLMATQSTKVIRNLTLDQGTIEQMRIRIGLKCGEDDARYLFGDRNDSGALDLMKGPIGTAVVNEEYIEASNVGFRAAYCDDVTQKKYLEQISTTYAHLDDKPQIFEGNRTTAMAEYDRCAALAPYSGGLTRIHFGEKIKVAPPFVLDVDRRRKHNMLICGTNEKMAENLMNIYMLSAIMNESAMLYCLDGDTIVGDCSSVDSYDAFRSYSDRFKYSMSRADIIKMIHEIYDQYKENKVSGANSKSVFVFIKNLQWLDLVQKMLKDENIDESEFLGDPMADSAADDSDPFGWVDNTSFGSSSNESVSYQLRKMIDDGSSCGVYFIISCTEYPVVKETMYYSDNILSKIPERIIFALNNSDADNLIDGVSVAQLKDNTVCFTDGVKNTFQFKPFVIRSSDEIKAILNNK